MEASRVRAPECEACPLNGQPKVWGIGPLDAPLLIVAEAPGSDEEKDREPLVGTTGQMVNALLRTNGLRREDVRLENVFQCKAPATSAKGRKAIGHCGPSLQSVISAMPRLRLVVAFGDAALAEVSGFNTTTRRAKAALAEGKRVAKVRASYDRALRKWNERLAKAALKGKAPTGKPPTLPPLVDAIAPGAVSGWDSITVFRGSPLRLPYRPDVWLMPIIHPAATMPWRSPRLRPLIGLDFRKAIGFLNGTRTVPSAEYTVVSSPAELLQWFAATPMGAIALDIEWSSVRQQLTCIGMGGPDGRYALLPVTTRERGELWSVPDMANIVLTLNEEFARPERQWGGHFACGYDERQLAKYGLTLRCQWDTLYGFHLCFAEFGSSRDESTVREGSYSQATGYDLGFISSVLTDFPYHKGVVGGGIDALDVPTPDLWKYCIGDVSRTYHSWLALRAEISEQFVPASRGFALLATEMEATRRAAQMTLQGVPIRATERANRILAWTQRLEQAKRAAAMDLGEPGFNLGSTLQLARALEARFNVAVRWKRGEDGRSRPQLDGRVVDQLLAQHPDNPLLGRVGEVRAATKELTAYAALQPDARGWAHPSWKVHGTVGSRWSCAPNFMNLSYQQREVIG